MFIRLRQNFVIFFSISQKVACNLTTVCVRPVLKLVFLFLTLENIATLVEWDDLQFYTVISKQNKTTQVKNEQEQPGTYRKDLPGGQVDILYQIMDPVLKFLEDQKNRSVFERAYLKKSSQKF